MKADDRAMSQRLAEVSHALQRAASCWSTMTRSARRPARRESRQGPWHVSIGGSPCLNMRTINRLGIVLTQSLLISRPGRSPSKTFFAARRASGLNPKVRIVDDIAQILHYLIRRQNH